VRRRLVEERESSGQRTYMFIEELLLNMLFPWDIGIFISE
jgi:hypothetical protein